MFDTVLIANRGEIAVRVTRTLRRMGIRAAAVYTDPDAGARHVREADLAVRLGGGPHGYLDADRIVAAARSVGADAVHPGYGFLAENAGFAAACQAAGIVFIGPPVSAIEVMGDKIAAKRTAERAGVPVVPGRHEPGLSDEDIAAAVAETGFPVLLKPSAGGGGKGMRKVTGPDHLADEIAAARREARAAFGDDTLLVERYVQGPRHIEIQVLADAHGNVVHLGERECSLQRRHQKIVEESPSPLIDAALRDRIGRTAVDLARAVGYTGAGTVEYVVSRYRPEEFFFLEMNTRLQVEHPVTELVTGLDLVEWQVRVAAGEPLGFAQDAVRFTGHAVEARIYAEDPAAGFLPTGGTVLRLTEPDGVRFDSGLATGTVVGSDYDPMLAKLVAWEPDRPAALRRARAALADTTVLGVTTNIAFLRELLADPDVAAGDLDTDLVTERLDRYVDRQVPADVYAAAALARLLDLEPSGPTVDPFDVPGGWRLGGPQRAAWTVWHMRVGGADPVEVRVRGRASAAEVAIGADPPVPASAARAGTDLLVSVDGIVTRFSHAHQDDVAWLGLGGRAWAVHEEERLHAGHHEDQVAGGELRAPMPGTVTMVKVSPGEPVRVGEALLVVEAMKMEHVIAAPIDGVLRELLVRPGARVRIDELLAVVTPEEAGT